MKTILNIKRLFLLVAILFSASAAMAASFSAEMVTTRKGKTESGRFYLKDQHYRLEAVEGGSTDFIAPMSGR
jgi:cell division protein FtsL